MSSWARFFLCATLPLFLKHNESPVGRARHSRPLPHRLSGLTPSPLRDMVILGAGQPLKAKAMGMTVLAYNRSDKSKQMQEDGVIPVTLKRPLLTVTVRAFIWRRHRIPGILSMRASCPL